MKITNIKISTHMQIASLVSYKSSTLKKINK